MSYLGKITHEKVVSGNFTVSEDFRPVTCWESQLFSGNQLRIKKTCFCSGSFVV